LIHLDGFSKFDFFCVLREADEIENVKSDISDQQKSIRKGRSSGLGALDSDELILNLVVKDCQIANKNAEGTYIQQSRQVN